MLNLHLGSFATWGAVVGLLFGLLVGGAAVSEARRARNSVRRITATGRILHVGDAFDKFDEVSGKALQVVFTTKSGEQVKFSEIVDENPYAVRQDIVVHYDPRRPLLTATVRTPREAFEKVRPLAICSVFLVGMSLLYFIFN